MTWEMRGGISIEKPSILRFRRGLRLYIIMCIYLLK